MRALARAITAIEDQEPQAEALLEQLFPPTGKAFLIGVTGAPGTGKSTLVDRLAATTAQGSSTVGIIAVDPTSPYTGGAILGDRIRMQEHSGDAGVFIRSMATRGFLGGLARATADVALLLDAAGKQVILLETVGVGQDEVDIVRLADCTLVLLVPGLGDDVQSMKAGLMEIADIFVLNKAEREGRRSPGAADRSHAGAGARPRRLEDAGGAHHGHRRHRRGATGRDDRDISRTRRSWRRTGEAARSATGSSGCARCWESICWNAPLPRAAAKRARIPGRRCSRTPREPLYCRA